MTSLPIALEIQKAFADSQLPEMMQKFQERAESLWSARAPAGRLPLSWRGR
ncbi:MAG: hypothetical protein IPN77_10800 [Sandaracinaceae bacterium]|nr:hypothetical protein [Sandaracinaceae bacterium]